MNNLEENNLNEIGKVNKIYFSPTELFIIGENETCVVGIKEHDDFDDCVIEFSPNSDIEESSLIESKDISSLETDLGNPIDVDISTHSFVLYFSNDRMLFFEIAPIDSEEEEFKYSGNISLNNLCVKIGIRQERVNNER